MIVKNNFINPNRQIKKLCRPQANYSGTAGYTMAMAPFLASGQENIDVSFVFSLIILISVTFLTMPDYFLTRLQRAVMFGSKPIDKEKGVMPDWKSGMIHFFIAGLAVPSLFSFFIVYFIRYFYIRFVSVFLDKMGYGQIELTPESLNADTSMVLYAVMLAMYYVGIWIGVLFSTQVLRKFMLGKRRRIVLWSTVYLIIATLFIYVGGKNIEIPFYSSTDFNFVDHILRIIIFFTLSYHYFYLLLRLAGDRKYLG